MDLNSTIAFGISNQNDCIAFLIVGDIDFVTHYRLVDPNKVESYAKAFVVEDDDMDTVLSFKVCNDSQILI